MGLKLMAETENNKDNVTGVNFAENALKTFSVLMLTQFVYLGISIITARALGPSGKGIFSVVNLYPIVLFTIGNLSIYRALTVAVAEKRYPLNLFPGSALVFVFFTSILMALGFIAAYFNFPNLFTKEATFSLILLSLSMLPFLFVINIFSSILEVKGRIDDLNLKNILHSIVLLAVVFASLCWFKMGVRGAVFSYVAANAFSALLLIYFVKKITPGPWKYNGRLLKNLIKDGLLLHVAVIANFVSLRIDVLMLGCYRPNSSVGYYSVAVSITELLFLISTALQMIFYSKVQDMMKDKEDMAKKTLRLYRHALLLFILGTGTLALLAKKIVILFYGEAFLPSLVPFFILLPGAMILYLNNLLVNYLVGVKKFILISIIFSFSSLLNVLLNILLIPKYDSAGAALSSTITYSINSILAWILFLVVSKYSLKDFFKSLIFTKDDFLMYCALIKNIAQGQKR